MKLQLLSDLHLESEAFDPLPAPAAELLVLAGDIDSTWAALERFRGWPVPVLFVAGNHEFDRRDIDVARAALRARCSALGLRLLDDESALHDGADGRRVRFLGSTRWCDFDLYGPERRDKAMRAAGYFVRVMQATRHGAPFDPAAVREQALACRTWLQGELARPSEGGWDATVVVTHYAPSLLSADRRYGMQPATASFCNADDDLLALADVWLHGHLHCRHDYAVARPSGTASRVVCNARGLAVKNEPDGYDAMKVIEV
jgi:hypothetical protein